MRNGLLIIYNNQDFSPYLVWNTLSKNEALNNNKNTCGFTLIDQSISENEQITIYDYVYNIKPILSSDDFMYVNDIYQFENKYYKGKEIEVDIFGIDKKMRILSVDSTTNKITFDSTIGQDLPVKTQHGFKFFSGIIDNVVETKLSKSSDDISYQYSLISFEKLMDRKVVIESYTSQYMREIFGRIVYKFVATDSSLQVSDLESSMTGSGLCSSTTNYGTDRIYGNFSQKGICTGNGYRYKTITGIDLSSYTHLRYWWKVSATQGGNMDKLTFRIGADASNYYEFNVSSIGSDYEDCWMYETPEMKSPSNVVGSPDWSNITWFSFYYEGDAVNFFLFDIVEATTGGIMMGPMKRGTVKIGNIQFNGIQPSICMENLTKNYQHFWYVDNDRALHYYYEDGEDISSYKIDPLDPIYNSLRISVDTTQIINRQLVEGNEAPSQSLYTQEKKADGVQTSFSIDYKPAGALIFPDGTSRQGLKAFVNNVEKTVGVEGLVDEALYDFVFNFNEKIIRNTSSFPTLSSTDDLKLTYYPYKTISVRYANNDSINLMKSLVGGDGIFDGKIIIDRTIDTVQLARQRAIIEVKTKKDPIVTYEFKTDIGGFQLGQMMKVIDTARAIDKYFQIQKISVIAKAGNMFQYTISLTQKFFDYVEFFQLLMKKSANFQTNTNVEIIIPGNVDETIGINENYVAVAVEDGYFAGMLYNKFWKFETYLGSATSPGYIGNKSQERLLTGNGTASIQSVSGYTNPKAIELVTTSSTTATIESELVQISPNIDFIISFDIKVLSQSGLGDIKLFFNEYDSDRLLLESHELIIDKTLPDFVNYLIELTTNNSIYFYKVGVKIDTLISDILLGGVVIQDQSTNTVINDASADFSFAS